MKVLAIDIGTTTGYAYVRPSLFKSGTECFKTGRGDSPGMKFLMFRGWLVQTIAKAEPDMIAYEIPYGPGAYARQVLDGFMAVLQMVAEENQVRCQSIHATSLKKWATGSGRAKKPEMIEAAKKKYPLMDIIDDNHADALLIMNWALEKF